ncbi:hypothetical protein [uncultured Roseobacter sp.]|uniref:hypothetical protein n=1 Tax=uncultured Roseobacter sp. TaxID=114847 RepID=UPI002636EEE6|nr:hypothetical protein [uncultured Roseobacter sp.]
MATSRKFLILLIGVALLGAAVWWMRPDPVTVEALISEAASRQIDRPVAVKIEMQNQSDDWAFVCGTVTEADGTVLKIGTGASEAAYESDAFCALAKISDMTELSEFDFGSTDMPAMDWLEKYNLDPAILSSDTQ